MVGGKPSDLLVEAPPSSTTADESCLLLAFVMVWRWIDSGLSKRLQLCFRGCCFCDLVHVPISFVVDFVVVLNHFGSIAPLA